MDNLKIIQYLFPAPDTIHFKGYEMGRQKSDILEKEGEPYDNVSSGKEETWLYSQKYEKILTEANFLFGKNAALKKIDLYLNFPGAEFNESTPEALSKDLVDYIKGQLGDPVIKMEKTSDGPAIYYSWKPKNEPLKEVVLIYYAEKDYLDSSGIKRVIKITQR